VGADRSPLPLRERDKCGSIPSPSGERVRVRVVSPDTQSPTIRRCNPCCKSPRIHNITGLDHCRRPGRVSIIFAGAAGTSAPVSTGR
jgi:hypothetical protein